MRIDKLFTIFLILLPVTNIYGCGIPGVSLGKIILVLLVCLSFLERRILYAPMIPKYWGPFMIWALVVPFFYIFNSWFSFPDAIYKFIGVLGFWLTLGYGLQMVDLSYAFKVYEKCAFVFSLLFLLQTVLYFIAGRNLVLLIPGLPLADATSINDYVTGQAVWNRQCSVFLEPAYFAIYIGIFLCLLLNRCSANLFTTKTLFYIAVLVLVRSGNGYFCLVAVFLLYILLNYHQVVVKKRNVVGVVVLFVASVFIFPNLVQNERFGETFDRVSELNATYGEGRTSGFERIYRGYYVFNELPVSAKIVGIGQGNLERYSAVHEFKTYANIGLGNTSFYLNGIQQILVFTGIVGVALLLVSAFKVCRQREAACVFLLYVSLSFMSATYNSPNMLLLFFFAAKNLKVMRQRLIVDSRDLKSAYRCML